MYVVYGLEDPRDHLIHYVGITDDVYTRFNQHIRGDGGNIEKNGWIFECRQQNIMIRMVELQRVATVEVATERERYWIRHYLDLGHPLNNAQIARSIRRERARLERLAEAERTTQRRLEVMLRKQEELKQKELKATEVIIPLMQQETISDKPIQMVPDRLQLALTTYQQGHVTCRALANMIGVKKTKAAELIQELKTMKLIS